MFNGARVSGPALRSPSTPSLMVESHARLAGRGKPDREF